MQAGEIKVVLTLDNGQFTIQTQKAGQTIQELKKSLDQTASSTQALEKHFTGLYQKFHDTVRTASLLRYALHDVSDIFTMLPGAILKSSGEMERLQTLMQGMSKATDDYTKKMEAASNVKFVFDLAQRTPFEVGALTDAFVKFKSAGLDPTNGSMKGLVDSVAKFGGNTETLHRASIAIQQMAGKGVISMEELRQQLGEAVPNAINMMAEGAGMSVQKFANLVKTGTVEAAASLRNMFTIMQLENAGASEAMMDTWVGLTSLLKTKFELFKVEAGQAGLFDEAKKAVREMIDAFDTLEARSLASTLGQGLGDALKAIKEAIEFVIKFGDEIKTVGELLILYWGASKLQGAMGGMREIFNQRMAMYREEIEKAEEANRRKAVMMTEEASRMRSKAAQEEAYAARSTQIAGQLYAQQARYAEQIAELERRNLGWAGQQKIDRLTERLNETRQAIVEIQTEAVARRQQAAELNRVADAQERLAAATRAGTSVSKADILIVQEANAHAQKTVGILDEKAKAAGRAASGITGLQTVMAGMQTVLSFFGGWVNIAIITLGYLADKLYEFLNRWKEAEEIQKRIKQGIANEKDAEKLSDRIAEKNKEIQAIENYLSRTVRPQMGSVDPTTSRGRQIKADQDFYDAQLAALKKAKIDRDGFIKSLQDQAAIFDKAAVDTEVAAFRRRLDSDVAKMFQAENSRIRDLEAQVAEKRERLLRDNPKATSVDVEKVGAEERNLIRQIRQKQTQDQIDFLRGESAKLQSELDKMASGDERNKIEAKLKLINDERNGLLTKALQLRQDAMKLGQIGLTNKPANDKPEDPLIRYVLSLENDLALARQRLSANVQGVRDIVQLRNEAVIKVLGDMAEGKFDKNIGKDENEVMRRKYIGDLEARKTYVKQFVEQLRNGSGDALAFVNSLTTLDDEAKKLTLRAIEAATGLTLQHERQRALTQAQQLAARATEELDAATVRFASNGLVKEDAAMLSLNKQLATLEQKLKGGTLNFEAYTKAKNDAIRDTVKTGNLNFAADQEQALRNATLEQVKATLTLGQSRKYEHDLEMTRIAAEQDRREELTWEALSTGAMTAEEFQKQMTIIADAGDKARAASVIKYQRESQTALEKLVKGWNDSVENMNQATARWAGTFMDNLVEMISGGEVQWKQFAAGIAKDLLKVFMQKELGGAVSKMFGSFGDTVGGMLGLGTTRGDTPANPLYVTDAAAGVAGKTATESMMGDLKKSMDETWTKVTDGLSSVWDSLKTNFSSFMDDLGGSLSSLWDGLSGMFSGGGGGGDFLTEAMAMFGFANGGVMTGLGPASLRKYATGGIATGPQLALFGEGSMNEAYVPLPDGRSIPVTLSGAATTNNTGGVQINITVNRDGTSSENSLGAEANQWQRVANRVRGVVMEELVAQQRPGGVLYK